MAKDGADPAVDHGGGHEGYMWRVRAPIASRRSGVYIVPSGVWEKIGFTLPGVSMSGQRIFQYEILEKLGEGGMGMVYKAHDTKLHRTVALKSLRNSIPITDSDKDRLRAEAQAAAALNHPNICSVIDILDDHDEQYIVMEFVDGETLKSQIDREKVSVREILDYAIQIADGLAEAHRKGIIHRDVKPENVIITSSGRAKIMDFGLQSATVCFMRPPILFAVTSKHRVSSSRCGS